MKKRRKETPRRPFTVPDTRCLVVWTHAVVKSVSLVRVCEVHQAAFGLVHLAEQVLHVAVPCPEDVCVWLEVRVPLDDLRAICRVLVFVLVLFFHCFLSVCVLRRRVCARWRKRCGAERGECVKTLGEKFFENVPTFFKLSGGSTNHTSCSKKARRQYSVAASCAQATLL